MIKIAEIVCGLQNGGVESMLYNYLYNMDISNYDIDIITYDKSNEITKQKFESIGCKIIEITPKRKNFIKSLNELYQCLKNGKYDVIHSHMSINNSIPLFLAKMVKTPNRISHSHQSKKIKNILKIVYEKINKFIIKRCANQYVACGEEAARYLYSNKLCNDKKVIILKNAIDLEKYKFNADSRAKIRRQYGIKNDDILLGHVGRFTYQKNQIFLIEILKKLNNSNYKMILIGDGELKQKIIEKVNEYNLNGAVIFLENITNIYDYFSAMDIFLLPSYFEGLPLVGIEAQANGIKCLFSSTIDRSLKINTNVKIFDLDIEKWVNECEKEQRIESEKNLRDNGYDIKQQVIKLCSIYNKGMK